MRGRNFRKLLHGRWATGNMVCVGLDPSWEKIPESLKTRGGMPRKPGDVLIDFNKALIDATGDIAGTFKPQSSYYEAHLEEGERALKATVDYMTERFPNIPRILDAKRGDILRTNEGYVTSKFDGHGFDACTVAPYLGGVESLRPFLDRTEEGIISICRTSNPDACEFQDMLTYQSAEKLFELLGDELPSYAKMAEWSRVNSDHYLVPLYQMVALRVSRVWNTNGNCLLVIGSTYPKEAKIVRYLVGDDVYFLTPGGKAQGGTVELGVPACRNSRGEGFIYNESSPICHASSGSDFAERARERTIEVNDGINEYRMAA